MSQIELSKFLSYVLRHRPDAIGIELDEEGFTDAKVWVEKMAERHPGFAMRDLEAIVRDDDKGRYTLRDGQIRASQGHSIEGITAFETTPKTPPATLYHGTSTQNWKRIREAGGLQRMNRHHVHLSPDEETAERVGARRKGRGDSAVCERETDGRGRLQVLPLRQRRVARRRSAYRLPERALDDLQAHGSNRRALLGKPARALVDHIELHRVGARLSRSF